ncbi:MAG: sodium:proline symporter, partial [Melioribacteraceae bacterium]|nr:sodium:proline symporter [Melioribacteraceae bacterium]
IVLGTTIVWVAVTYLTKPVDKNKLHTFYKKVHPGGKGWKKISNELPEVKSDSGFGRSFVNWISGVVLIYASLFGIGRIIFADFTAGFIYLLIGAIATFIIYKNLKQQDVMQN